MTIDETPFRKIIGNLKPPSSALYSQTDWDTAFQSINPTQDDVKLYEAAKWIAEEFVEARKLFRSPSFGPLSSEWATVLAIASLNREYRTAVELRDDEAKKLKSKNFVSFDAHSGIRITGPSGQHFTLDDFVESSTDITENWLFDALKVSNHAQLPEELSWFAINAGKSYSFRKAMNTLWNLAWHDGWYYELKAGGCANWVPRNVHTENLRQAWLIRQQTNLMNFAYVDMTVWPLLTETQRRRKSRHKAVTLAKRVGNSVRIRVSSPSYLSKKLPLFNIERSALEGSYLSDFLETKMPKTSGLTVSILLLAWHLIVDIAENLKQNVALPTYLTPEHAKALELTIPTVSLLRAIREGLNVDEITAAAIIDFLTFKVKSGKNEKGNRGLWSAPLVKVPGCDEYSLPLPPLLTSNPIRKIEAWLEKGGIDDSNAVTSRGDKFESVYRAQLKEKLTENEEFINAAIAQNGVKKSKSFPEQVDLLLSFGGLCLVGEIKLFLMPTDPNERSRYQKKLESAASQAKRKLEELVKRPDVVASSLGISTDEATELRYLPIVVTAQDYGFSTKINDVLIVEGGFLSTYLHGGEIVVGRAVQRGSARTTDKTRRYYKNEAGAAYDFETEVSSPYVLRRVIDRYKWSSSPYPTLAHKSATIAVPVFNDIDGLERLEAEMMVETLGSKQTRK